jgi:hypothetical protein
MVVISVWEEDAGSGGSFRTAAGTADRFGVVLKPLLSFLIGWPTTVWKSKKD